MRNVEVRTAEHNDTTYNLEPARHLNKPNHTNSVGK